MNWYTPSWAVPEIRWSLENQNTTGSAAAPKEMEAWLRPEMSSVICAVAVIWTAD